jgi:hypothetical protein
MEEFAISAGYKRYYDAANLAYAIRDQQPRVITFTRTPSSTGVVGNFSTTPAQTYYSLDASDLETPYTDEFKAAIKFVDPITEGDWRCVTSIAVRGTNTLPRHRRTPLTF